MYHYTQPPSPSHCLLNDRGRVVQILPVFDVPVPAGLDGCDEGMQMQMVDAVVRRFVVAVPVTLEGVVGLEELLGCCLPAP